MKHSSTYAALLVLATCPALGCGAGAAANTVRPDDPSASDALGEDGGTFRCTKVPARGEPLVVDWQTKDQLDLTVAMKKGVAVVAYDCKSIRVLRDCSVKGGYGFTAVPSVLQESVQIDDADEVRASLPLGGAALSGEVARGASIDIGLAYVGKQATLNETVTKAELVGADCAGATHFVRGSTLGAFVVSKGTKGKVRAAAEIFGAGASAASSSEKHRLNAGGDIAACKQSKDGGAQPPDGCSAVVRLELLALADGATKPAPSSGMPVLENTCLEGYAPSGGRCVRKSSSAAAYRCSPDDVEECKSQCDKGNVDSCYNAAKLLMDKEPLGAAAVPTLQRACDGKVGLACYSLAVVHKLNPTRELNDPAKSRVLFRRACDMLVPQACEWVGDSDRDLAWPERASYYKRSCDLGRFEGCAALAKAYLEGREGLPRRTQDGTAILDRACTAGRGTACASLAELYTAGRVLSGSATDVQPDPKRAAEYQAKACSRGASGYKLKCST